MIGNPDQQGHPERDGWLALREGRWADARSAFERLVADTESAAGFEGLSWAAWWVDDADVVFASRERAFHLYKAAGDRANAARMAVWIASDLLDFEGAFAPAQGWLARARRLLDGLDPEPAHGWLAFLEGYVARGEGRTEEAVALARAAADAGRRFDVPDLEMLGLALEGSAAVAGSEVESGMRCLDEATALALEGGAEVPIAGAWACCFMVTACGTVRDFERAGHWCDRIAEFAERWGSRFMLAFCRAEYGEIHLWRGEWQQAEELLDAAIEDFAASRPAMSGEVFACLAELRRRQGRSGETAELLERAGAGSRAQLCRARVELDRGQIVDAAERAERIIRQAGGRGTALAPALEVLIAARARAGDTRAGEDALEDLREMAATVATRALLGAAELAAARVARTGGDLEAARARAEDAADLLARAGGRFEAAEARLELATVLLELDRRDAGEHEAAAALEVFMELGAQPAAERARRLLGGDERGATALAPLTPREREVVELLTEGLTNREIAERLVLSEHTVHRHVTNVLRKLGLPSRTAVAAYAARSEASSGRSG